MNQNVQNSTICISQNVETNSNVYQLMNGLQNCGMHIHRTKYYLPTERNEVMKYTTTRMNFENIMLSERSQTQKPTYDMIPFMRDLGEIHRRERKSAVAEGWGLRGWGTNRWRLKL